MLDVDVTGPPAASARTAATMRRVADGLLTQDVRLGADGVALAVDPSRWYASQSIRPAGEQLARTIGFSIAPFGSAALDDDAAIGRSLAVVCHADARACEHLARLGCSVAHVALGCRAQQGEGEERTTQLLTFGSTAPRRLRVIAHGAAWFDELRCAHRFWDALDPAPADDPLLTATVLLDIGDEDDPAPDQEILLSSAEAGIAIATERLGEWPAGIEEHVLRAPLETLFARARELAADPQHAQAMAARLHAVLVKARPLEAMGAELAEVVAGVAAAGPGPGHHDAPAPSERALPARPRTIAEILDSERMRPDAGIRAGLQQALHRLRRLERRLDGAGGDDVVETLLDRRSDGPCEVSVLVPCYAARRTLLETLDSVAATAAEDGAPPVEIVLVDDGSPEGEGALAVEWAAGNDLAIVVLRHGHNRGLPQTRNTALEHARGELALPLDADNLLRPRGVRRLVDGLRAHPDAAFAYGILQEFDVRGPIGLRGLHPWQPERLRYGNYIDALALIRRDALRELGGYTPEPQDQPYQGYEDWDLWCRCAERGLAGAWVPEIVAGYRVRLDSMAAGLHLSHVAPLADMLERHPDLLI